MGTCTHLCAPTNVIAWISRRTTENKKSSLCRAAHKELRHCWRIRFRLGGVIENG